MKLKPCAIPVKRVDLRRRYRRSAGLSLVEVLIALAISAILLTATMVAVDASFYAYATAANTAATQSATRMVTHRLLTLIRTSTAHGPLDADPDNDPPATITNDVITSPYMELMDADGNLIRIEYRPNQQELWMQQIPASGGTPVAQPVLGGVTNAVFYAKRRLNNDGLWVLERGTMDITVQPGVDQTLELENRVADPIRVIGSTMPRKLEAD